MPSLALTNWSTNRAAELDRLEAAHLALGGGGPGRKYALVQINHAYAVLLSSQFQGFCRDLHGECVTVIVANASPAAIQSLLDADLRLHRQLDRSNPTPGAIGADFNRLGLWFWDDVRSHDSRTSRRMELLQELNSWRNAIAHHDFTAVGGSDSLRLELVRAWRSACTGLARSFDAVLQVRLRDRFGQVPW